MEISAFPPFFCKLEPLPLTILFDSVLPADRVKISHCDVKFEYKLRHLAIRHTDVLMVYI